MTDHSLSQPPTTQSPNLPPSQSLLELYQTLCRERKLTEDPEQHLAVKKLDLLRHRLESHKRWFSLWPQALFGKTPPLRGLYLYGGVGRGKTMLMDLFYDHVSIEQKQRYHFHEFMQMIHHRIKDLSQKGGKDHPLETIAKSLRASARLICFDEFHFKDITDAMLLKRLFHFLWKHGVIVVATSNFHPQDLYENGYQRNLVLPFLQKMATTFELCDLDSHTDYRSSKHATFVGTETIRHFVGNLEKGKHVLWKQFQTATNFAPVEQLELMVNGRPWWVPCVSETTLFASFEQLCGDTVGSQDYLALSRRIQTVYLWGVPKLSDQDLDKIKRFITLIDILYDKNTTLFMASSVDIEELYSDGKETTLFERTTSRLKDLLRNESPI